jgi:hypothetical protein
VDQVKLVERTLEVCMDADDGDHGTGLQARVKTLRKSIKKFARDIDKKEEELKI